MSNLYRATFAALSATTALVQAQPQAPHPSDAATAVPAVEYRSTFTQYRTAPDEESSADKMWHSANAEVGNLGGHAGHMREAGDASTQQAMRGAPNAAKSTPAAVPAGHHQHHGGDQ